LAYDESPVEDAHRTVRLPDSDRYWITLGARYELSRAIAIDVAYAHLFFDDAPIHNISPRPRLLAWQIQSASFEALLDIVGIQMVLGF
jgi:long-chain fatty acid transport protein